VIAFPVRRLFLARAVTDMRRSFDTLSGMVSSQLGHDPHSGDAFIFVGKDRRRMKVIIYSPSCRQSRRWTKKSSRASRRTCRPNVHYRNPHFPSYLP